MGVGALPPLERLAFLPPGDPASPDAGRIPRAGRLSHRYLCRSAAWPGSVPHYHCAMAASQSEKEAR